jgi:preprotein translocase subunit SecA
MAGRGTDIMLGGNPEFLAKKDMRAREIPEEIIAEANGTSDTDNVEIIEARKLFSELYQKYKAEIAPEADEVRAAGGLFILGTERHESRRIDNQLRGRSGRQGDPGESRFYLSLEDDLMRLFGSDRIIGLVDRMGLDENTPIDAKMLSNSIEGAQKKIEDNNFKRRKYVLSYDDVMNQQRTIIYKQRRDVLDGGDDIENTIKRMMLSNIRETIAAHTADESACEWSFDGLRSSLAYICNEDDFNYTVDELKKLKREDIEEMLSERALAKYAEKDELFGHDTFLEIQRSILLRNVDTSWMEHIDTMDDLKGMINLQSYAQRDPVTEYRITSGDMFDAMVAEIRDKTVRTILSVVPRPAQQIQRVQVANPISAGFAGGSQQSVKKVSIKKAPAERVGRNDPCPCGSGKKYKNCCGAASNQN